MSGPKVMSDKYILDGKTPVPASLMEWARWFENSHARRGVGHTEFDGGYVSTVFLGLDHRFGTAGDPLLFETMIFGGPHDGYQERYCTWDEAEAGHAKAVALVRREPEEHR
jgi:hypothetical protein